MYPILFQFEIPFTDFGVISVFFHGILTALGFVIAVLWFLRHAQNQHLHLEFFLDHFFALLFWGVVGARLGYVYLFFVRYQHDPMTMLYLWDGGFLLWSGIIFFLLALLYFTARQKEKIGQWMDVLVPASILAMLFESIGAFLGGNNYGKPTELPWGISFENAEVPYTIPIHPVQLYLFFSLLIVMMVISVLHQRRVRESMVGLISLNLFALASFFVEYFRGDEMIILFGLRFTQMLQLLVFIFSLALIHLNSTRERY